MERYLYCSDIDGTLNRQGYYLADDTKALVNEIVDKDIWFTVATGRFLSRTLPIIEELNLKIPAICLVGALAYDNASKRIIKVWPIAKAAAEEVITRLQDLSHRCHATVYQPKENRCLTAYNLLKSKQPYPMDKVNELGLLHDEIVVKDDLRPLLEECQALLIDMVGEEELLKQGYDLVKDIPGINVYLHQSPHTPGLWVLDIVAADSGKGNAIRWLKDYMKADVSVAFGDNFNDLPMLEAADIGVTMAESPDSLKAVVDLVLPPTPNCVPEYVLEREAE